MSRRLLKDDTAKVVIFRKVGGVIPVNSSALPGNGQETPSLACSRTGMDKRRRLRLVPGREWTRDAVSGLFPDGNGQETPSPARSRPGMGKKRRLRLIPQ